MAEQIDKPGFESWNIGQEQKKHFHSEQSGNNPTSREKIGQIFSFIYFF